MSTGILAAKPDSAARRSHWQEQAAAESLAFPADVAPERLDHDTCEGSGPQPGEPAIGTHRWRTFARRQPFGSVAQLKDGTIVIVAAGQALSLPEAGYWSLMEMLSEASQRITVEAMQATQKAARRGGAGSCQREREGR